MGAPGLDSETWDSTNPSNRRGPVRGLFADSLLCWVADLLTRRLAARTQTRFFNSPQDWVPHPKRALCV